MIYRMAALVGALALAGCSGGSPFESPAIADAKREVSEQLVDGSSARFENVVAQKTTMEGTAIRPVGAGEEAVCGWVNAKNRMGAYVGAERFLVKQGLSTFRGGDESAWANAFGMCVIHSDNEEAGARLTREGERAIQAYSDAVDAITAN